MRSTNWIKELVDIEKEMEESGVLDINAGYNPDANLEKETIQFLTEIKELFIDYATVFNTHRGVDLGGIKIYGISRTQADFMLFRNGFKLFFMMEKPGKIMIRSQHHGTDYIPGKTISEQEIKFLNADEFIEARWGAFGEILWTHKELLVNKDSLVKYYFSKFVKDSVK